MMVNFGSLIEEVSRIVQNNEITNNPNPSWESKIYKMDEKVYRENYEKNKKIVQLINDR